MPCKACSGVSQFELSSEFIVPRPSQLRTAVPPPRGSEDIRGALQARSGLRRSMARAYARTLHVCRRWPARSQAAIAAAMRILRWSGFESVDDLLRGAHHQDRHAASTIAFWPGWRTLIVVTLSAGVGALVGLLFR